MTPLASVFADLALSRDGVAISDEAKAVAAASVASRVQRLGGEPRVVLLSDPDPLTFALSFLTLLEAGHCPVPTAHDPSPVASARLREAHPGAFHWTGETLAAPTVAGQAERGTYGCLTSGTTGTPKLCLLSVEGALANARAHARSLGLAGKHTLLQSLPLHHSFGLVAYVFTPIVVRCALDFVTGFATFRTLGKRSLRDAALHVSPAQLRFMLKERAAPAPDGLAIVSVGGGLADPPELDALRQRVPAARVFVTYGLTEAGPRVLTGEVTGPRPRGYLGRAIDGVALAVRADDGTLLASGEGHLCVATPSLKRNIEATERSDDGRFLVTRDRVVLTTEGEVTFLHRGGDLVKVGGVSVYPGEIEAIARTHPEVTDAVVLKRPDPLYEEVFDLVVESPRPDLDLSAFLQERLTVVQFPKRTFALTSLPRSALGKVDRTRLAQSIEDAHARMDREP